MRSLLDFIVGNRWIEDGSVYIRFFHTVLPGRWAYLFEWAATFVCLLIFVNRPASTQLGAFRRLVRRFSTPHWRACLIVFALAIFGRLALLTIEPFPGLKVDDEASFLLQADTFAHGRLANPPLSFWRHFEPPHVLMEPTYSSMYPPAPAAFLAAGQTVFGTPRAGVLVSMAVAAAALCWMLQAWVPAEWALLGGLIAVVRLAWFSYFGNTYWGGSAGMIGGCLLLGAAGRLRRTGRARTRDAVILTFSLCLLANSRPYEGFVMALPLCLWMLWRFRGHLASPAFRAAASVLLIGGAITAYYCYRVTGRLEFPQALQRSQWAMTPSLLFQKPSYNHVYDFPDLDGLYRQYELSSYLRETSPSGYVREIPDKLFVEWLFFVSPALTVAALAGILATFRSRKYRLPLAAFLCLCLALAFETWVQPRYVAVGAGILYLFLINGLRFLAAGRRMTASKWQRTAPRLVSGTLAAIAIALACRLLVVPIDQWPHSWSSWGQEMPSYRAINRWLHDRPQKQLILVHYDGNHFWGDSWINNGADLSTQKVIWVRDTGSVASNDDVICAFPDHEVLLFHPPNTGYEEMPDTTFRANWDVGTFFAPYQTHGTCKSESAQAYARH